MHLITNAAVYSSLLARLQRLTPDASRRGGGTLAAPEMQRHLIDSVRAVTGARVASARESWTSRVILKFFALYVPLPWPKGFPTRPELDPSGGGTCTSITTCDSSDFSRLEQSNLAASLRQRPKPVVAHTSTGASVRSGIMRELCLFARFQRETTPASPANPLPRSNIDAGSGVAIPV